MSAGRPAARSRFVPGRGLFLAILGTLPLLGLGAGPSPAWWVLLLDALVLTVAVWDGRRAPRLVLTRRLPRRLLLGADNEVTVLAVNPSDRPFRGVLRDDPPGGWRAEPDELPLHLPPRGRVEARYRLVPDRRGVGRFGDLHLRGEGPLGLGAWLHRIPAAIAARAYPEVLGPGRAGWVARVADPARVGRRRALRRGGGAELDELREYVPGDSLRDIDWKATAKRVRPTTRAYREERGQQIIVGIDLGRTMATRLGDRTKLDHAIDAALLLAAAAARQEDRVGLVLFSHRVEAFLPPAQGRGQVRRVLQAVLDVQARETAVDYRSFAELVGRRVPRRSLLVLLSDLLDESQVDALSRQAATLRRRHLMVCALLEDEVAARLASAPVRDEREVYRRAAAADLLDERRLLTHRLRRAGVSLVEAPGARLAVAAVERYLEIKARHAL
ncbi:MAG TPA: DUF58 domain-containing protein [Polyangiaceae bacterium LLY-WYZ-14_1]|nr:DUF58 domain-containing protein [Polyangiaceae bacterium LLY-WYZ-14_1]